MKKSAFRKTRQELGFTLEDIAEKMGYSARTVETWDQGRAEPSRPAKIILGYLKADHRLRLVVAKGEGE